MAERIHQKKPSSSTSTLLSITTICLLITLALTLDGCGHTALLTGQISSDQNPDESPRLDPKSVAVAAAWHEPEGTIGPNLHTKGELSLIGAASGAVEGLLAAASAGPVGILLAPVAVPVGLVIGAADGNEQGSTKEQIAHSGADWSQVASSLQFQRRFQEKLVAQLKQEAIAEAVFAQVDIDSSSMKDNDQSNQYAAEVLLEIGVIQLEIHQEAKANNDEEHRYGFELAVQARAIDPRNQATLDQMRHLFRSPPHTARELLQDDGALFKQLVDLGFEESAQAIVLEFFRIYYPPTAWEPNDSMNYAVPYYALRLKYPPEPPRWRLGEFADVDSIQPLFMWESFPRPFEQRAGRDQTPNYSNVTYDISVYKQIEHVWEGGFLRPSVTYYTSGPLVYERHGLNEPQHRIDLLLEYCSVYSWTVRARFDLDGHPRTTEWSQLEATAPPWKIRRALLRSDYLSLANNGERYLRFRAPPPPGISKCKGYK